MILKNLTLCLLVDNVVKKHKKIPKKGNDFLNGAIAKGVTHTFLATNLCT